MDGSIRSHNADLPCFKRFKSDGLSICWNKHLTKASLVCVPIVAAGVILNAIFDWIVIAVIVWAAWEFLNQKFRRRVDPFK